MMWASKYLLCTSTAIFVRSGFSQVNIGRKYWDRVIHLAEDLDIGTIAVHTRVRRVLWGQRRGAREGCNVEDFYTPRGMYEYVQMVFTKKLKIFV